MARRSFKTYESFLSKLSMGAIGTRGVFKDLEKQGHNPLELERGSMDYKIWKEIKIKRIRVPDLLCTSCGKRVESRAKTDLKITMSHSTSDAERGWDSGLENQDYIAFVGCSKSGDGPTNWIASSEIQYVSVKDLRKAFRERKVKITKPKGAEEGFESRVEWPSVVASASGIITSLEDKKLQYQRTNDKRTIQHSFLRGEVGEVKLISLVRKGQKIFEHQILASVVPVASKFPCDHSASLKKYLQDVGSSSLSTRYTATKALSMYNTAPVVKALTIKIQDESEHIFVRLEAAASLARHGHKEGVEFIGRCLNDEFLPHRLEAIIVLGELNQEISGKLLVTVLKDKEQHAEIRAAAAWALGELKHKGALQALVQCFSEVQAGIREEAARALLKLAEPYNKDIVAQFSESTPQIRPGIAWALSRCESANIAQLIGSLKDEDTRQWAAYIIGNQNPLTYVKELELLKRKDPEVYFAATVLWKVLTSWVNGLEAY